MTAPAYNAKQLAEGRLTADHVTELVRFWQLAHGLAPDGMAGPRTLATLGPAEMTIPGHWLEGPGVTQVPAHTSWYGGTLAAGRPLGIVAHYTATDPGTAMAMASRRARPFVSEQDRLASWHISIEADGSVVQMVPLHHRAWHAGSSTAKPVPALGNANANTIGIELVGHGKEFPPAQVEAAKQVWRALVRRYGIEREHAMITHQSIDPTRRSDPGPVWIGEHAQAVLDAAYG